MSYIAGMELIPKQCLKCSEVKPPECFSPDKRRADWLQGQCKACRAVDEEGRRQRATPERVAEKVEWARRDYACKRARKRAYLADWKERNQERVREMHRASQYRKRYGITIADFDLRLAEQGGRCAVCREIFVSRPHVDHDHASGVVRGLLCAACNLGVGVIERPGFCDAVAAYLHRAQPSGRQSGAGSG